MAAAAHLQQVLQALERRLKAHRPLARACPQLLFDLTALLSGLRSLIMLDHAAGATPVQLQQSLQPLAELLPSFEGCILHLEGCCYLGNSVQLQQRLAALAADSSIWPVIITFHGNEHPPTADLAVAKPEQTGELQQQLQQLSASLKQQLQQQQQQLCSPAAAGSPAGRRMAVIDLGRMQGLPAMPTLNGFLLGYPVVYWVRDLDEAAAASKALSTTRLHLHTVRATCSCLDASSSGGSGANRKAGNGSSSISCGVLMAFTVPEALCTPSVDEKVQQVLQAVKAAAGSAADGDAGCGGGDAVLTDGVWCDIGLSVEAVGPRPVSL